MHVGVSRTSRSAGLNYAALGLVLALGVGGCAMESIPAPVPAMQLVAPSTLPSPQDIVVPLPVPASPPPTLEPPPLKRQGAVKTGKPYQVRGTWYYPSAGSGYDEQGIASWYGPNFNGKSTANGETYNMYHLSAAHPTLPLPSYVEVTNTQNGRTIVVRVNDRGPYKHGRILDLSKRAAELLSVTQSGTAPVRVRFLKMAPLVGGDEFAERFLQKQSWYRGSQMSAGAAPALPATLKVRGRKTNDGAWQALLQQP
jgi:rare lipoprotein A